MEEMKVELVSLLEPCDVQIVSYPQVKPQLTDEQLLERRRKTAERVRRCRERKKFQKQILANSSSSVDNWPASQRAGRRSLGMFNAESTPTGRLRLVATETFSSPESEVVSRISETIDITEDEEEAIETTAIMDLEQQRSKEKDPLEVKVHLSAEEISRTVTQTSRIEEIVVGLEESYSGPVLGPNIHGTCYCEKNANEVSTSSLSSFKDDCADSTFNGAAHGENIFRRKCQQSNCRGCVVEVISPVQRFEIPHKNLLRCVSNFTSKSAVLDIAGQIGLPEATFNFLTTLTDVDLNITCQQFTRMWRSILLRRVQEVQSKSTCRRVPNMIPLTSGGMMVPAPLSDLLNSIGRFHSTATGVIHLTIAPEKVALSPEEDWWTVDNEIVSLWARTMSRLKNKFMMKEVPWATDYDGRPLMMTQVEVTQQRMVQCMAKTNEIGLTDGCVHMVNDPLYNPSIYAFEECHLVVSSPVNQDYLRIEYLQSHLISDEV